MQVPRQQQSQTTQLSSITVLHCYHRYENPLTCRTYQMLRLYSSFCQGLQVIPLPVPVAMM